MKRFLLSVILVLAACCSISAQTTSTSGAPVWRGNRTTGNQPATCISTRGEWYYNTTDKVYKWCSATNTWSALGGGGGGASIGGTVTGGTTPRVPFIDTGGVLGEDAGFTYDKVNNLLFVGGTHYVRTGEADSLGGVWFDQATPDRYNAALAGNSVVTNLNVPAGGNIYFKVDNTAYAQLNSTAFNFLSASAVRTPITIQAHAAQSNDTFTIFASDGTTKMFSVDAVGVPIVSQETRTATGNITKATTIVNNAGATNQTLPTAVGITGKRYVVKNVGAGTATVNTTSAQTIFTTSAVASVNLATGDGRTFESNGANWISY